MEASGPGGPPENLQELLGDAIPPVQAALRNLLDQGLVNKCAYSKGQIALARKFADAKTSSLRRVGRDELSNLVDKSANILRITATVICESQRHDDAQNAASMVLLQPAPARVALLKLLAAMVLWNPGVQLPAASGWEQRYSDAPNVIAEERERPGATVAAAGTAEGKVQRQQRPEVAGCDTRLVQRLLQLQYGVCRLVSELLARKACRLHDLVRADVPRLLLLLDAGCSLLQTHVLQCLSRQLAAVSGVLLLQLPPEATAAAEPMRGEQQQQHQHQHQHRQQQQRQQQQQQHQQQQEEDGRDQQGIGEASSPLPGLLPAAQGAAPAGGAASSSSGGATGLLHAARRAFDVATALMPCLYSLMSIAADVCCAAAAGSGSSSGLRPSRGSQPYGGAAGSSQLRQLSRRFLLHMADGLRDSHLLDHWARALLLCALCGAEEERRGCETLTRRQAAAGGAGNGGGGVSGAAGQAGSGLAADAAGTSQQQQQQQALSRTHSEVYWCATFVIGNALHRLKEARRTGDAAGSPPSPDPCCTALQQALSGPCTQHLTLALGTLMLHEADEGPLYGMPLPYRTGHVADMLGVAARDLAASGSIAQPLRLLGRAMYGNLLCLLTDPGKGPPPTLPAVPPEGHVDLLLRLGRLAVRSAQAYRGQACSGVGPRPVVVIQRQDMASIAFQSLQTARELLHSSAGRSIAAAVGSAPGAGVGARAGAETAGGAVGAAGGGAGAEVARTDMDTDTDTAQQAAALSGCPVGLRGAGGAATARRRTTRAPVDAETRWHRLLLDTGLWVEMEEEDVAVWGEAWSHFNSLGQLGSGTGACYANTQ